MIRLMMYTARPICLRPGKVCGCAAMRRERPPVDMQRVYQAQVKCFRRVRRGNFGREGS